MARIVYIQLFWIVRSFTRICNRLEGNLQYVLLDDDDDDDVCLCVCVCVVSFSFYDGMVPTLGTNGI